MNQRNQRRPSSPRSAFLLLVLLAALPFGCGDEGMVEPPQTNRQIPGLLYTVAGLAGSRGNSGDNGPAIGARLYWPMDMYVHPVSRELYIVDWHNHSYRRIGRDGMIATAFGSRPGDDAQGHADLLRMYLPADVIAGPNGDLYLALWGNGRVVRVDAVTNYAVTEAVTPPDPDPPGPQQFFGDVVLPSSVVLDPVGTIYFTNQGTGRISKIDSNGIRTWVGRYAKGYRNGVGQAAMFSWSRGPNAKPGGKLAITPDGRTMYVADQENNRIRKIDVPTAEVTTFAGSGDTGYSGDGGQALSARLNYPCDVTCAPDGDVYFADTRNHVVRRIDVRGVITTVAGNGTAGCSPDGTIAIQAMLNEPYGVFFDAPSGTLYIADTYNSQIRAVIISD